MRFSNAGKAVLAVIFALIVGLTVGGWVLYGEQIAVRAFLLGIGILVFVLLHKFITSILILVVWIIAAVIVIYPFSSGNYYAALVIRQRDAAYWISIDGTPYTLNGEHFGNYSNGRFVIEGTITGNSMSYQGQYYTVTGFFESWPIIAVAPDRSKHELVFTPR